MHQIDHRDIPEGALVYAVVHEDFGLIEASPSLDRALAVADRAAREAGGCYALDSAPPGREVEAGLQIAANPKNAPLAALKATGLRPLGLKEVMRLDLEEALDEWSYLMPTEKPEKGKMVPVYIWGQIDRVVGFVRRGRGLLRDNYKLSKTEDEAAFTYVLGLTLLPARSVYDGYLGDDAERPLPLANTPPRGKTLCTYSTAECRAACLVFSGQQPINYNLEVKQGLTLALLKHPAAFLRVLVQACDLHLGCGGRHFPYVRLNVLSDIPWELFTPWLFKMFPGKAYGTEKHAFYDYTKIPGRVAPGNYDLTYSYASTEPRHHDMAMRELAAGRRVAVVFLLPGNYNQRKEMEFPETWLGHRIVDGDRHDVRPRNPQKVIVGLRYKSAVSVKEKDLQRGALGKFVVRLPNPRPPVKVNVVRVRKVDGMLVVDQTPQHTGVLPEL